MNAKQFPALLLLSFLAVHPLAVAWAARSGSESLFNWLAVTVAADILAVEPGKSTRADVIQKFGKPGVNGEVLFWKRVNAQPDLHVRLKNNVVTSWTFALPVEGPEARAIPYEELSRWIPPEQERRAMEEMRKQPKSHEFGRTFKVTLPAEGVALIFGTDSKKTLHEIVRFKKGERPPG